MLEAVHFMHDGLAVCEDINSPLWWSIQCDGTYTRDQLSRVMALVPEDIGLEEHKRKVRLVGFETGEEARYYAERVYAVLCVRK